MEKGGAFFMMIEPMLAKTTWIMGDKMTVVDFWVGAMYCDKMTNPMLDAHQMGCWKIVISKCPNVKRWGEAFKKENAQWLMKRPKRAN